MFEGGTRCFPLESGVHNKFSDQKYVLQQRKRIVGVVDEAHEHVLKLHNKVLEVSVISRDLEKNKIVMMRDYKNYRLAEVIDSTSKTIPSKAKVVIPKKTGMIFNGKEYITEDTIIYYETTS